MELLTRRAVLAAGLAAAASPALSRLARGTAPESPDITLTAGAARAALSGPAYGETACWGYNGQVPGPTLRVRQGDRLRATVRNALAEPTTVHWHGIRLPNAMDGVPHLTQDPIAPGESFVYDFALPDAGTYWYHPHMNSSEQVGRGLAGALIVEEREPPQVDREVLWVLDDWRLDEGEAITNDFGHPRDLSHNGRLGNIATINGGSPETLDVRAGERIRLRLVNVANARAFGLTFAGHAPQIIALDGQPAAPHAPADGKVVLAPSQRADLIIDMGGKPGERFQVRDEYYARQTYKLIEIAYADGQPLRESPLDAPVRLPANPIPEPDLSAAERHEVLLEGGAMGGMRGAMMGGRRMGMRALVDKGRFWAINGVSFGESDTTIDPLLTLKRDRPVILAMRNETAWEHPMHLHGHSFRVIRRKGQETAHREWRDTVLVPPRETVEVAFVADNPGDWMFHCHVLEHQIAGMMGVVRVA